MSTIATVQSRRTQNRNGLLGRYRECIVVLAENPDADCASEADFLIADLSLSLRDLQHDIATVRAVNEKQQAAENHDGEQRYQAARRRFESLLSQVDEARAAVARAEPNRDGRQRLEAQVRQLRSTNPRIYGG